MSVSGRHDKSTPARPTSGTTRDRTGNVRATDGPLPREDELSCRSRLPCIQTGSRNAEHCNLDGNQGEEKVELAARSSLGGKTPAPQVRTCPGVKGSGGGTLGIIRADKTRGCFSSVNTTLRSGSSRQREKERRHSFHVPGKKEKKKEKCLWTPSDPREGAGPTGTMAARQRRIQGLLTRPRYHGGVTGGGGRSRSRVCSQVSAS